ncbi:MAG: NAD(P)H-hydrate dehydratase [Acidobacteriota bacterium]|jgi:hydroxyethylthiazole kinase-like uncharacterized protein yjeF
MKILTADQMREVDRLSTEETGIPSLTLMENAGFHLYLALRDRFEDLADLNIAVICGKGNNGGDGMVLARQLVQREIYPDIILLAKHEQISGDAAVNLDILAHSGVPVFEMSTEEAWEEFSRTLEVYDIVVDAILGTGITQPLHGFFARVVSDLNDVPAFVLSVDIPSGMVSDAVEPPPLCVAADATVTFTAPKIAHILSQELEAVGELSIVSIGSPQNLLDRPEHRVNLLTSEELADAVLPRPVASHKGVYGHVVLITGSRGKAGAAGLCSYSALRTGSGLVTVYTPRDAQPTVAAFHPEVMTEGLPSTPDGTFSREAIHLALDLLQGMTAVGMGPGLTTNDETVDFIRTVVAQSPVPLILDADGLNAFKDCPDRLKNEHGQPLILTPHPGEFARLTGLSIPEILSDPIGSATEFAQRLGLWLVLKSYRTLIAAPGGEVYVSPCGNPGMATAGMGDVLTGVLTSMIGQYLASGLKEHSDITRGVCLGVFLHGLAGDLAADEEGWEHLVAGDVILALGDAYDELLEAAIQA